MRKYLYFLIALCASLALIAVVDGAVGAEPAELSRVLVAILGKAATCVGATLFFLAVNRVLFPKFEIGRVIRGEDPFPQSGRGRAPGGLHSRLVPVVRSHADGLFARRGVLGCDA